MSVGYAFVPEDEEWLGWAMSPMSELRPGDVFKFVLEEDLAPLGLLSEEPLPDPEGTKRALDDLVMLAPIMRYVEPGEPDIAGRAGCRASVY